MDLFQKILFTILFVLLNVSSVLYVVNSTSLTTSLSIDFYEDSCPQVELVIQNELTKKLYPIAHNITIPGTLRLFFHDCFIQGCDGSILISPTNDNNSERNATINQSLASDAFDVVEKSKSALEKVCPGVVSCADILAILARDVVVTWGGPKWEVEKGRRDGLISNASEADLYMPKSHHNLTALIREFESIGLSTADLVTLSGAHTIGFTHCNEFSNRIFNNDSSLNPITRKKVISSCHFPKAGDSDFEALDQNTPLQFDNKYFESLTERKGLLNSDHQLAFGDDDMSRNLVYNYAKDQKLFFQEFAKAMVKLGRVGVKTGMEGEIRTKCSAFN